LLPSPNGCGSGVGVKVGSSVPRLLVRGSRVERARIGRCDGTSAWRSDSQNPNGAQQTLPSLENMPIAVAAMPHHKIPSQDFVLEKVSLTPGWRGKWALRFHGSTQRWGQRVGEQDSMDCSRRHARTIHAPSRDKANETQGRCSSCVRRSRHSTRTTARKQARQWKPHLSHLFGKRSFAEKRSYPNIDALGTGCTAAAEKKA